MKLNVLAPNQTVISTDKYEVLFSYNTPVAAHLLVSGDYYRTNKKWSKTTTKHINSWVPSDAVLVDQSVLDNFL